MISSLTADSLSGLTLLGMLVCLTTTGAVAAQSIGSTDDIDMCNFSASARFIEGAPRDRFVVQNESSGGWDISSLGLDLSPSAGNLFFDVTAEGAGAEVFQPFRTESVGAALLKQPQIIDGDQSISLSFSTFGPGIQFEFSIDVDDQLSESELGQIRITGSEIRDAVITLGISDNQGNARILSGVFSETSEVLFGSDAC